MKTIDPELLRQLLRYDPETGKLFWRPRPLEMFKAERDQRRWNSRYAGQEAFASRRAGGYRQGDIFDRTYLTHRIIWAMTHDEWPEQIDHINGNPADNRLSNLRAVSQSENMRNQRRRTDNASGVTGIHWHKQHSKWHAYIATDNGRVHLGTFETREAAISARQAAERSHGYHQNHGRNV